MSNEKLAEALRDLLRVCELRIADYRRSEIDRRRIRAAKDALQAHAAEAAQTMTPSELADRIARGEKWRLADETPQPAQDAKLPSDEDFRLHLGELTPAELRVAQAAARYVLAGERAQDAKDAARYRWLKENDNLYLPAEDVIDEAMDAMAKESGR